MKRWLAWGLGGLVAVGVLVRLGVSSGQEKAPSADRASTPEVVRPTPAPLADEQYRESLLKDDTLPAPPPTAPASQRQIFQETLRAIEAGKDPLQPKGSVRDQLPAELKARLEKRRALVDERHAKARAERDARRAKSDERRREADLRAGKTPLPPGQRPQLPPDDPARQEPPAKLPPPLIEDKP